MKYIIKLALRNIWRNKRRSILAITSVFFAVMLIMYLQGMMGGMMGAMTKNSMKNDTGHIRITTIGFEERSRFIPVDENVYEPDKIIEKINSDKKINSKISLICKRIQFGVLLNKNGQNKQALAMAGDPEKEKDMLMLQKSIIKGRYIKKERDTIVGEKIAKALKLNLNDKLKVVTEGSDGSLRLRKFNIVGIFKTGMNVLDDMVFQIGLKDAMKMLRTGDSVQQIVIMLKDYKKADKVAREIGKLINDEDIAVVPWTKSSKIAGVVKVVGTTYNFIYIAIAFLGVIIIVNIMMMVVMERRKEIGIIKSMGISKREVLLLFLFEGIALGFIGSLCGMFAGTGINLILSQVGRDISDMLPGDDIRFPIETRIYHKIILLDIIKVFFMGIIISGIVSIFPAWKAARMNVVDAIKSV